jgi:hypothetical protein
VFQKVGSAESRFQCALARFGLPNEILRKIPEWLPFGEDRTNRKAQMKVWSGLALSGLHPPGAVAALCIARLRDPVLLYRISSEAEECRRSCVDALVEMIETEDLRSQTVVRLTNFLIRHPEDVGDHILRAWIGSLPLKRNGRIAHSLLGKLLIESPGFFALESVFPETIRVIAKLSESDQIDNPTRSNFASWLKPILAKWGVFASSSLSSWRNLLNRSATDIGEELFEWNQLLFEELFESKSVYRRYDRLWNNFPSRGR